MTFLQAAISVLESVGRALTAEEITTQALQRGLISTSGKTPAATMGAALYLDLRDNPNTRLVRHAEPGPNRARRGNVRWSLTRLGPLVAQAAVNVQVEVPANEANEFAKLIATERYRNEERDYKWAVHLVLSALLADRNLSRPDITDLISDVFGQTMPDLAALGLSQEDQQIVQAAPLGAAGIRGAMANLAGGKWGLAQFSWIPRAIEYQLGMPIAQAFRDLIDEDAPLASRVDSFRNQLYAVCKGLQTRGGFLPNWRLLAVQLSFVAMVLGAYDPLRYAFYSHKALRHAYQRYAPGTDWPKGSAGERYEGMCEFVRAVATDLSSQGVPIKDLIDAQSFIWRALEDTHPAPSGQVAFPIELGLDSEPRLDMDVIAADLAKAVYWPAEKARQLVRMVHRWRQVLFQGPPGTGKTFVAARLARLLCQDEDERLEVVQFHPSYAYEDFVEGIRPVVTEGSSLSYEVRKGVFLRLADLAKEHPDDDFFLVIDELNRANLPRVFGELLYALEYRGPENTFRLPYSGDESYVPANITFIATMNTADRSIALVDAAIRRRFRHVNFGPDLGVLKAWLSDHGLADLADQAAARLNALNDQLLQLLDANRLIGHTYLMREDLAESGFETVWDEDLEPVLSEHLFNQPEELKKLRDTFLTPA
jgi:SpoVK/Ycf46/Vps4 family AAA+-type ATPase